MEEAPVRNTIVTDQAPKPLDPYSQAVVEGGFIFVAGQQQKPFSFNAEDAEELQLRPRRA
jgi:enamine deaminase RidA (YjgF/YER057c/UK114 family)